MLVQDVMSTSVATIGADATLEEAAWAMLAHGVDALLVMDGENPAGIIGVRDLFTAPVAASLARSMPGGRTEHALRAIWRSQTVRDQMSDQVLTVNEELPAMQAAALMVNFGKHPLPVLRDGRIVGTIDRWHIVRAILELPVADSDSAADRARAGAEV